MLLVGLALQQGILPVVSLFARSLVAVVVILSLLIHHM